MTLDYMFVAPTTILVPFPPTYCWMCSVSVLCVSKKYKILYKHINNIKVVYLKLLLVKFVVKLNVSLTHQTIQTLRKQCQNTLQLVHGAKFKNKQHNQPTKIVIYFIQFKKTQVLYYIWNSCLSEKNKHTFNPEPSHSYDNICLEPMQEHVYGYFRKILSLYLSAILCSYVLQRQK